MNAIDIIDECVAQREEYTVTVGVFENSQPRFIVFGGGGAIVAPKQYEYELCGLTQCITAAMAQQLILENRLSLQSPLSAFFSDIPSDKDFTVQDLLTHTTGIRLPLSLKAKIAAAAFKPQINPTLNIDGASALELLKAGKVNASRAFSPCELNYALLGEIIAVVQGRGYQCLMQELLESSLKLHGFRCSNGEGDLAAPYWHRGANDAFLAANGAVSNITAALRFLQAALSYNKLIAACMQPINGIKTPSGYAVGLGWLVCENKFVWQSGANAAFNAFWGIDAQQERAVCVLTNTRARSGARAAQAGLLYMHEKRRGSDYIFM